MAYYVVVPFVEFAPTVRAETLLKIGSLSSCALISLAVSIANNDFLVASRVVMQLLILCLSDLDLRTLERRARNLKG